MLSSKTSNASFFKEAEELFKGVLGKFEKDSVGVEFNNFHLELKIYTGTTILKGLRLGLSRQIDEMTFIYYDFGEGSSNREVLIEFQEKDIVMLEEALMNFINENENFSSLLKEEDKKG